jgi:predicted dehydrogenase
VSRVSVAVVGAGGWGSNLVRTYHRSPLAELRYCCDLDRAKLNQMAGLYPGIRTTQNYRDLLADPELQSVVVATSAPTHYELCKEALLAGKDVYVEKPFVLKVADANELIALARQRERILMVGHLLEYHPVVLYLKDMIGRGEFGRLHYLYSQRVNLGTVRQDENALWNFAPHDISVMMFLTGQAPSDVAARGQSYLQRSIQDVVFMTMNFGNQMMGHVHVSWLDPHKIRKLTIVGSRRMAVFDDLDANEKLRIYDKGVDVKSEYTSFAEYVGLRFGDIVIPHIQLTEPLAIECRHFLECVATRRQPVSDGEDGLRVVRVLDAAQRSLMANGSPMELA